MANREDDVTGVFIIDSDKANSRATKVAPL